MGYRVLGECFSFVGRITLYRTDTRRRREDVVDASEVAKDCKEEGRSQGSGRGVTWRY
jgi:hypothetical protein